MSILSRPGDPSPARNTTSPTPRAALPPGVVSRDRPVPAHWDSVEKLMYRLALCSHEPIMYGRRAKPLAPPMEHLFLSPSLLRAFRCHVGCTACCDVSITLDYLPDEYATMQWKPGIREEAEAETGFHARPVTINGVTREVMTFPQYAHPACPFLKPTRDGGVLGCGFWTPNATQPLECSSAPQLLMTTRGPGTTVLMKKPFGRGWSWRYKPQCEFDPLLNNPGQVLTTDLTDTRDLLRRYLAWADYFEIETVIPTILDLLESLRDVIVRDGLHMVQVV